MLSSYNEDRPCVARWVARSQVCNLVQARSHLDGLTYDAVILYLYESHLATCPFLGICMFSGWIKICEMLNQYLIERFLR